MTDTTTPRITTQHSAAAFFKCHYRTIRSWIEKGIIRGYRDGNSILVDLNDIEAAIRNGKILDPRRPRYGDSAVIVPLPNSGAVR